MRIHLAEIILWSAIGTPIVAQQPTRQLENLTPTPIVRSIRVEPISTSREGLPAVPFSAIHEAWKKADVALAVESRLDVDSIVEAQKAIQDIYKSTGRPVRVDHQVIQMPPGSAVEVVFRVIELCGCR